MIRKIRSIEKFGSFEGFDWDSNVLDKTGRPLWFEAVNILYGQNYSGKTTLSRIIRAMETHELPPRYDRIRFSVECDGNLTVTQDTLANVVFPVRVFNEDFVHENLRFLSDPDGEIKPFAILGADNAAIQNEIDRIHSELGSSEEGHETGLYLESRLRRMNADKMRKQCNSEQDRLNKLLRDKATGRVNGIKYQSQYFGDQNYNITKLLSDIRELQEHRYQPLSLEQVEIYRKQVQEQIMPAVKQISIPENAGALWAEMCRLSSELVSRKIGTSRKIQELLLNTALNDWVKRGAELLDGKKICAFCGNPVSDDRWAAIHAHFDEETKRLDEEIEQVITKIEDMKSRIRSFLHLRSEDFYLRYRQTADETVARWDIVCGKYDTALDALLNQLRRRQAEITRQFDLDSPTFDGEELVAVLQSAFQIIKENNEYSKAIDAERKRAQNALRMQEVYKFCQEIRYEEWMKRIQELDACAKNMENAKNETAKEIQKKESLLRDQRAALNDEEAGARRVNQYLSEYFGHRFVSLASEKTEGEEKRIRFQIVRDGKPAYHLSEGECSLIAFCYFMAKLDDINTAGEKPVIWIDDPISSLDSNHIYFVYSLILAKIAESENFEQLFVSTHNLDFLKYLRRLKKKGTNKQYFLIERIGAKSVLGIMPGYLKDRATEFNYLFSIIYRCAQCSVITDENYDILYHFGNSARKFFEIYLSFKYPNSEKMNLEEGLKLFFGGDKIPSAIMNRMLNEESHGTPLEKSLRMEIDPETIPAARKILEKLQNADEQQYDALVRSIEEES